MLFISSRPQCVKLCSILCLSTVSHTESPPEIPLPPPVVPRPLPEGVVIDPPIIEPPVIDPPVIDPPVIDPPVIDPPVIDPPVIDPPVIDPPVRPLPEIQPRDWALNSTNIGQLTSEQISLRQSDTPANTQRNKRHFDVIITCLSCRLFSGTKVETKRPPIRRWHFQIHSRAWKLSYFDSDFTEFMPELVRIMAWHRTGGRPS